MAASAARVAPPMLAMLAGAPAWISLGQSAVIDAGTTARVAALPPFWWLAVLVIAALAMTAAARLSLARAYPLALSVLLWLPYLPGRVPAAFLMWQGPLKGLVWIAIAAGVLFADPPLWLSAAARIGAAPRRAPWIAALVAATAYAVGAWSLADLLPGGDDGGLLAYNDRAGYDLFLDWASSAVDLPAAFPSLHRQSLAAAGMDAVLWIAAGTGLAGFAWMLTRRRAGKGATWTATAATASVAFMVTSSVVWAGTTPRRCGRAFRSGRFSGPGIRLPAR